MMALVFAAKFEEGLPCSSTAFQYFDERGKVPAKVDGDFAEKERFLIYDDLTCCGRQNIPITDAIVI